MSVDRAANKIRGVSRRASQCLVAGLVAGGAAWALIGASSAQATVTVGSPLTASFTGVFGGTATEINFALGEPGSQVTSPVNGTIVSYRVRVFSSSTGRFAIRAIRPAPGGEFTGAGTSTPVTPPGTGLQTLSANLPIRAGDFVGLDLVDSTSSVAFASGVTGSTVYEFGNPGFLADGATAPPANTYTGELAFNAEVAPSNNFTLDRTTRNKKKGTATLHFTLPYPGDLSGSGNGAKVASASGGVISKAVDAGPAQLLIKAKGKKKRKLNETGKVKLNVAVTYTPTNGNPNTQSVKVKLKKKL